MNWLNYCIQLLVSAGVAGVVTIFLVQTWVKTRIEQSIKHEYDKKLEEVRYEVRKREQAAIAAEFFSQWVFINDPKWEKDHARRLNKASYESFLWLPDEIIVEMSKTTTGASDSQKLSQILLSCRKIIQNDPNNKLESKNVVTFGQLATQQ
jgi:hypothetical protein